jgi:hypothetical protein
MYKRRKKKKNWRCWDLNPRPLDLKEHTIPFRHRDLLVNWAQKCVYTAIFITKVTKKELQDNVLFLDMINILISKSILVNIHRLKLCKFLNVKTTEL